MGEPEECGEEGSKGGEEECVGEVMEYVGESRVLSLDVGAAGPVLDDWGVGNEMVPGAVPDLRTCRVGEAIADLVGNRKCIR